MMDGTDRHCRYFHRLISRHARLYSEMVTAPAVLHGDRDYLLGFDASEHDVALQLGGSDPVELAQAAKIGEEFGYDEINLNVGCPSDRVQSGTFGACLMRTPDLVAQCVRAMGEAVRVPVTVKCRIGVDDQDPEESLFELVEKVAAAGCSVFIVHARKAWLKGLSPRENRIVPPLDYALVRKLKQAFPTLTIILNGGLDDCSMAHREMTGLDGVMLGRAPYARPWVLHDVDRMFFGEDISTVTRQEIAMVMHDYIQHMMHERQVKPHAVTRHMLGLFHGEPGARVWRQSLSTLGSKTPGDIIPIALSRLAQTQAETHPDASPLSAIL